MKELERHLGVSYPTARARFDDLMGKLGLESPGEGEPEDPRTRSTSARITVLEDLAEGVIGVDEALKRLAPEAS